MDQSDTQARRDGQGLDTFKVVFARSKLSVTVQPGESIVDAAMRVGVYIPTSCGEGMCGTCATAVIEGIPDHRDSFLMGASREDNKTITPCCSRSHTDTIVLDI